MRDATVALVTAMAAGFNHIFYGLLEWRDFGAEPPYAFL